MSEHLSTGESVAFIDMVMEYSGLCECAIYNSNILLIISKATVKKRTTSVAYQLSTLGEGLIRYMIRAMHPPADGAISSPQESYNRIYPTRENECL